MGTPVLLVATATGWLGTARMPRSLATAGFEVALLAPRGALAAKSRFVARLGHLPDGATPVQWVHAFAAMVKATSPRLVVPCDDVAFRLLQMLAVSPPDRLSPALAHELRPLIVDSLGDPAHYRTSVDKTLLPGAAAALGVRVPPHAVVATLGAAESFAGAHGYPVVLKRDESTAGDGVEIVEARERLAPAFTRLALQDRSGSTGHGARALVIQARIPGMIHYENTCAWRGERIAGFAVARLAYADAKGPAAVIRCYHSPQIREFSSRLVRGFGMTGLFASEYIVHEATGEAYLLEINRRLTPGMHVGPRVDVDLCAALHSVLRGEAVAGRTAMSAGEEWINVHFPQEWLRDPESAYLRDYPVDVPWDEPELFEAMVASANR